MNKRQLGYSINSSSSPRITILLADDHAKFRESLKIVIESDGDIEVVGQAKNGLEALSLTRILRPQVVVMDIAMPLLNGLQAIRRVAQLFPSTRVLVLSAHPDLEYIKQAVVFGACGYLIKQSSAEVLGVAVRAAVEGRCYFSFSIPKGFRDELRVLFAKLKSMKKKEATRLAAA
jgi:DNA-binding NarL/FixJ family response regulator